MFSRHLWPVDKSDGSEGLKFITWNLIQTTEEVARAFIVAASAATVQSTCMSIVFSSKLRWEWQPNAEASATILENHEGVLILSRPVRTLQSKSPHGSKAAMIEALAEVVGLHVTLHVYLCIMHPLSIYCFTYTMQNNAWTLNLFLSGFISSLPQLAWEKRLCCCCCCCVCKTTKVISQIELFYLLAWLMWSPAILFTRKKWNMTKVDTVLKLFI